MSARMELEVYEERPPASWPSLNQYDWLLPFQTREFLDVWIDTVGAARKTACYFVVVKSNGRNALMLPLGIEKRNGLRSLTFLDGGLVDYNCPVLFDGASEIDAHGANWILSEVTKSIPRFDYIDFQRMPEMIGGLRNPFSYLKCTSSKASGHFLRLDDGNERFSRSQNSYAKDTRRQWRRLAKIAPTEVVTAKNEPEFAKIMAALIRQKVRKYPDFFSRPGFLEYFSSMTRAHSSSGFVHCSALFVGETIVASHWGLRTRRSFYYLVPGHEGGQWETFSPGRVLMEALVSKAHEEGVQKFDLGIGDELYKKKLGSRAVSLLDCQLPASVPGRAYLWLREVRRKISIRADN